MSHRNTFIAMSAIIAVLSIGSVALTWFLLDSMDDGMSDTYDICGIYRNESSEGSVTVRDLSETVHDKILQFTYDITTSGGSVTSFQSILGLFDHNDRPDLLIYGHVGDVEIDGITYDGWTSESDGFTFTYCFGEGQSVNVILIDSEDTHMVAKLVSG